jgi:hypothetical protein
MLAILAIVVAILACVWGSVVLWTWMLSYALRARDTRPGGDGEDER